MDFLTEVYVRKSNLTQNTQAPGSCVKFLQKHPRLEVVVIFTDPTLGSWLLFWVVYVEILQNITDMLFRE